MPVHPHRHRQIKVTHAAICKFSSDKPAIRSELLNEPGLNAHHLTPQKAGCIDEMTTMSQQIVLSLIRFRIASWSPGASAGDQDGLKVVRHCVPVR